MRICYAGSKPPELFNTVSGIGDEKESYLKDLLFPGTEIGFVTTSKNWSCDYAKSPTGATIYLSELCLVQAAIQAQSEGYDAVVFGFT